MQHNKPKSGRQAIIQAAKDGHNPKPENISGQTLPLFYTPNIPAHSGSLPLEPTTGNRPHSQCQRTVPAAKREDFKF
jgi:hypothetical protein